jgi:BirA family biotin operon repressor/biotin-[acetyl-CoA-carboxylase] ligase
MDEATLADRLGAPVTVFESTPDTSAHLRKRARTGAPHGTFAVANELTAARGRSGSAWAAPPGGVWSSTLLYPAFGPEHVGRLTFAGGVATAELARSFGVDARLKWPNDVLVGGRKLAGVLTEAVVDAVPVAGKPVDEAIDDPDDLECAILGIGVNADLDPEALDTDRAVTTLRAETGGPVDRTEIAARLHERVLDRAAQVETEAGFATLLDDWCELSRTLGAHVRVTVGGGEEIVGTAGDVDETGALLVETEEGERRVTEGDCEKMRRD